MNERALFIWYWQDINPCGFIWYYKISFGEHKTALDKPQVRVNEGWIIEVLLYMTFVLTDDVLLNTKVHLFNLL